MRRTVARFGGCLQLLRPFDRRVLVLRAGPGRRPPLSRRATARRLGVTPRGVRRSELRGLRRLRGIARSRGCGGGTGGPLVSAASAASSGLFDAVGAVALFAPAVPQEAGDPAAPDRSAGQGRVLSSRRGSASVPRAAQLSPIGPLEDAEGGGPALAIIAALLAATLALGMLALRLRRSEQAPDGAAAPPAERDPRDWEPPPAPWSRD